MKIRFTADSTCDASESIRAKYPLDIIPLTVELDGKYYKDGIDLFPDDIISAVDRGAPIPKTSAINVEECEAFFKEILKDCDAVIHFDIGSEFSSCFQNARIAAEGLPVYCVDGRNLSCGTALLIAVAQELAKEGMAPEAIVEKLNAMTDKVDMTFIVDRLDFLYKGGRCSMISMLGANVLHLRPCIEVHDSKMVVGKKYRGTYERCLKSYLKDRLTDKDSIDDNMLIIVHTGMTDETIEEIKTLIANEMEFKQVFVSRAGATITSHCGANTFGICFLHK